MPRAPTAVLLVTASCLLSACAGAPTRSGFLTSYEAMKPVEDAVRAKVNTHRTPEALKAVTRVTIAPTQILPTAHGGWMNEAERQALLREIDAQLCFELSERYEIVSAEDLEAARVRAAITNVTPTGRVGSAAAAAASFFIPGPIGVRAPGTTGSLAAEAEMLAPRTGKQIAAVSWNRAATPIGTDDPSLSRIGDALQFAEPFADTVGEVMEPDDAKKREFSSDEDPCKAYGARFRPEGWAAKFATGLYVPQLSGASREKAEEEPASK